MEPITGTLLPLSGDEGATTSDNSATGSGLVTLSPAQLAQLINEAVAKAAGFNNTPQITTNSSVAGGLIARVAFKPPQPLHTQNPNVWFEILEQQFLVAGITMEATMYAHAVGALDARLHDTLAYLITSAKGTHPYTTFKTEVIRVLGESEKSKLNNLMHGLTLGDRKPSQLLSAMRLNAGNNLNDTTLRQFWMKRLPQQVQMVLTPFENDVSLAVLAERADNVHETMTQAQVNVLETSASVSNLNPTILSIDQKLSELHKTILSEISELFQHNSRSRSNSNSNRRYNSRSQSGSNNSRQDSPNFRNSYYHNSGDPSSSNNFTCYYHQRFGTKANKCKTGCLFLSKSNSSDINVSKN